MNYDAPFYDAVCIICLITSLMNCPLSCFLADIFLLVSFDYLFRSLYVHAT